jgi:hypothetical protein
LSQPAESSLSGAALHADVLVTEVQPNGNHQKNQPATHDQGTAKESNFPEVVFRGGALIHGTLR